MIEISLAVHLIDKLRIARSYIKRGEDSWIPERLAKGRSLFLKPMWGGDSFLDGMTVYAPYDTYAVMVISSISCANFEKS
jgi:hypothetical protein